MAGYNEGPGNSDLSEEEMEKLRKAVEKAFKGLKPAEGTPDNMGMTEEAVTTTKDGGEVVLN